MRKRTMSREMALQFLYQIDLTHLDLESQGLFTLDELITRGESSENHVDVKAYATRLIKKITYHKSHIDRWIEKCSDNWRMNRMAIVDRNILRMGTCEIMYFDDIPSKVAINEAIELAKKFGDSESSKFVNGILDKISKENDGSV